MRKKPETAKAAVKNDAKAAMAPSQGDSHNSGVHSASPGGDRDATRKPDDHSAPKRPVTGKRPAS
ncbi:MAG TPA: hypothetical protein VGC51_09935 [Hansschlegelia sp.]